MSKARQTISDDIYEDEEEDLSHYEPEVEGTRQSVNSQRAVSLTRRVCTKQSPYMKAFYQHQPLHITLDTVGLKSA